jgi:protein-L-isoaspartate O-methyltransferase
MVSTAAEERTLRPDTAGCPDISLQWVEQLAPGGFTLIPLQHGIKGHNPLARI